MLAGELYHAADPELQAELAACAQALRIINALSNEETAAHFRKLFGSCGDGTAIRSPFFCDYGHNIHFGARGFVNFNCVFLDCNRIEIGDDAQIGPGVHIYTAWHPIDPTVRRSGLEGASPVKIGNNVWIGGGAIILPGVTIGEDSIVGAGSVVTRDVPARVIAVGSPARVAEKLP